MNRNPSIAPTDMPTNTNAFEGGTPETIYSSVLYQNNVGTLKLTDEQLSFHTSQKVSVLPWSKVVKRQVLSSGGGDSVKHKTKLVLASGNEAIFQLSDRVSLEVLRDDLAERLQTYRKIFKPEEDIAVNKTVAPASRRMSTPYRFVSANSDRNLMKDSSHRSTASANYDDTIRVSAGPNKKSGKQRSAPPMSDGIKVSAGRPPQRQPHRQERRMSTPYRFVSAASQRNLDSSSRSASSDNIRVSAGTKKNSSKQPSSSRRESAPYGYASANQSMKDHSRRSAASSVTSSKKENGKKVPNKQGRRQSMPYRFTSPTEDIPRNSRTGRQSGSHHKPIRRQSVSSHYASSDDSSVEEFVEDFGEDVFVEDFAPKRTSNHNRRGSVATKKTNKRNGTTSKEEEKAHSYNRFFGSNKSASSRNVKKTQPRRSGRRASLA